MRDSRGWTPEVSDAVWADLRPKIDKFGFAVIGIFDPDSGGDANWAYTVGLSSRGMAELVMHGLPMELLHGWVNRVGHTSLERGADEELGRRNDSSLLWLIPVDEPLDPRYPLSLARHWAAAHDQPLRAIQLVWADLENRWPWDDDFDPVLAGLQPVRGTAVPE